MARNPLRAPHRPHRAAPTKCDAARDSGWTEGSRSGEVFFCLHFARGCCTRGSSCRYLHRIPTGDDERVLPTGQDCFGRERHVEDRDDMGGVGSFSRTRFVLFLGRITEMDAAKVEGGLRREFGQFGRLKSVRHIPRKGCAFVRFLHRPCIEFAKAAMENQPFPDGGAESLNVRWAHKDPNNRDQDPEPDEVASAVASAVREGRIEEDELFDGPRAKRIRRAAAPQFVPGPYTVESQGYAPRASRHLTYEPPEGEEEEEAAAGTSAPAQAASAPQQSTAGGGVQVGAPVAPSAPASGAAGAGHGQSFAQQFAAAAAMDAAAAIPPPRMVAQGSARGGGDAATKAADSSDDDSDRGTKGGMDLLTGYGSGSDSDA